ncbi:AIPR family protein [Nocardia carnea]|uniref:AIPR family protein n=1 Tax=Nocardia carnea TaxID=37328 RepID=UPI002456EF1D|nr:AIPR family protein [Nocardia carnea]
MNNWIRRDTPYEAWQGTVPVQNVSTWFEEHSDRLFEQNVRNSLGRTRIDSGIKDTLREEPENFWYFNNRIWRSVELHRAVGDALAIERKQLNGRAADVTRRGKMLISHLVFQRVEQDLLDDPAADWSAVLARVPDWTSQCASWLIYHLDAEYGRNSFLSSTFIDETRCRHQAKIVLEDVAVGREVPELLPDYRPPARRARRSRRPNSVALLVDAGTINDGTSLYFHTETEPKGQAVDRWLAADPRRAQATWVNDRLKCLLWAYDGKQYSATGLVQAIWSLAPYEHSPVAVQGTRRWKLAGGESLADLASGLHKEESEAE